MDVNERVRQLRQILLDLENARASPGLVEVLRKKADDLRNEILEALLSRIRSLVRVCFSAYGPWYRKARLTEEDLVNECVLKASKVVHRFDPDRGARLWTWLEKVLRRMLTDLYRKRRRDVEKREPLPQAIPEKQGSEDPFRGIQVADTMQRIYEKASERFEPWMVLAHQMYHLENMTFQAVAKTLKKGLSTIHNVVARVQQWIIDNFRGGPDDDTPHQEQ